MAIHGNKSQAARTRALAEFKSSKLQVLVATDIAARGIDIDQLPHVVNYDLPNVPEDYVHRIGRTGRAGATGEAVSLVCVDEHGLLRDIERFIKREITREVVAGFEPDPNAKAQPIQLRSQEHRQRSGPRTNNRSGAQPNGDKRGGSGNGGAGGRQPAGKPARSGSGQSTQATSPQRSQTPRTGLSSTTSGRPALGGQAAANANQQRRRSGQR